MATKRKTYSRQFIAALLERDEHRKKLNREKMRRYRASLKAKKERANAV